MAVDALRFASIVFTAVAMAGGFAHLLELPNKIGLSREEYLTVQQIYRGWALLGIPVAGALLATSLPAVLVRHERTQFYLTLAAALCIALSLAALRAHPLAAREARVSGQAHPARRRTGRADELAAIERWHGRGRDGACPRRAAA